MLEWMKVHFRLGLLIQENYISYWEMGESVCKLCRPLWKTWKKINKSTKNVRDVVKNTKQCYKQHTNVAWSLYSLLLFISECMKLGGLTLEGSHALPYSQAPLCSRISEVVRNLPLSHRWLSNALLIMRYCAETSLFIAADKILLSGWIICNTPSCLMTPECKLRTAWTRAENFPK